MKNLFIGNNPFTQNIKEIQGQFIEIDHEQFYVITNYDSMLPFFICLTSASDLWMYISSKGGLTAGRKNPNQALFPYYSDDKIIDSGELTGSKTMMYVLKNGKQYLWEPFSEYYKGVYAIERTLSKSTTGNKLIFSERNIDLGLTFKYSWMSSDDFGWIKKSSLMKENIEPLEIRIIDGLQNVLPAGIDNLTQNTYSTLVDAYKKTEIVGESNLALFRMESIMVDRAEPSESLRANSIWHYGLENPSFLVSTSQLDNFRNGLDICPETESKGVKGALFVTSNFVLDSNTPKTWYFIAEVNQDATQINNLLKVIEESEDIGKIIENSIQAGTKSLYQTVAQADGIQITTDIHGVARHFSNVLFNTMRGGIYSENDIIYASHFSNHIKHFNLKEWKINQVFLALLPFSIKYLELEKLVLKTNNPNFYRLFLEYLPLTFSRRHGDPSRPWNQFNINIKDIAGNKVLAYQGNWRDIFQNWEALSLSFPGYIHAIIAKFLNASTADGYNPYKITNEGIEWEVIEPENPWSNIGYWGDHQIIYLLRLMEISVTHFPEKLQSWLVEDIFAFANVPYRLKNYDDIVANPKDTIQFDMALHERIEKRIPGFGADAKLTHNQENEVILVNLTEKLLVTLLSKLSNFIPEAGIWMNTLRPEWNDANNALVGNGASMVTLYYMRRFVKFVQKLFEHASIEKFEVSKEIHCFIERMIAAFTKFEPLLLSGFNDIQRRLFTDQAGNAGNEYRNSIYKRNIIKKREINHVEINNLLGLALKYIDHSIEANQRVDKMYHAYNLISFTPKAISVNHLYEMLEGQVAVMSSGKLSANEVAALLDAMKNSSLFREDQQSYMLYPNRNLPLFIEKNKIDATDVNRINFLKQLVNKDDTSIITSDNKGTYHFNADLKNAQFLNNAITELKRNNRFVITDEDQLEVNKVYEKLFKHQSFTGRSGTFYKYEGLGCIYWHMVSKLLLATGECIHSAISQNADPTIMNRLTKHYDEIKEGIGANKSPQKYGSFPFDPYSHTPLMSGVQQPGMTGQVKEDIINRFFELGVFVEKGQLYFKPAILKRDEFIIDDHRDAEFQYPYLAFTYCSTEIIYIIDGEKGIDIMNCNGKAETLNSNSLNIEQSKSVFNREGKINRITVHLNDQNIRKGETVVN